MPNWSEVEDLHSFLRTVLESYPEPDEVFRYSAKTQSDDLRVGEAEVPDYKRLLKDVGLEATQAAVTDGDRFDYQAPSNTDIPHIPYIAVLDPTESHSTRYGRYVVYLFDPIEREVHLTLNIGATEMATGFAKRLGSKPIEQSASDILQWLAH